MRGQVFLDGRYGRDQLWKFEGGAEIPASPSPHVAPAPRSADDYVHPEQVFVASLSNCHRLLFLQLACQASFLVDNYVDEALGIVANDELGRVAMTKITKYKEQLKCLTWV